MEYINGIFTSREQAHQSAQQLQKSLGRYHNREPLQVKLAYNENHLGGAGDVVQAASQMLMSPISNYDLHTMLRKVEEDDTTRKLLLIGHSQGSLYANSLYDYVTTHGSPARSVGVYLFATPASYVAGGGKYMTSADDVVIFGTSLFARSIGVPVPLPSNISLPHGDSKDLAASHSLGTYLDGAPDRVLAEVGTQLDQLQSTPENAEGPCFEAPDVSASDKVQGTLLAIADPLANLAKEALVLAYKSTATIALAAGDVARVGQQAFRSISLSSTDPSDNPLVLRNEKKNFLIVKKLYGSSIDEETYDELNKVSAVILEPSPVPAVPITTEPVVQELVAAPTSTPPAPIFMPYVGIAGNSLPPVETAITAPSDLEDEANASTTVPVPSPPPPQNIFTASTTPPLLVAAECSASLSPAFCLIATTTATLIWSDTEYVTFYTLQVNNVAHATTTATSTVLSLQDQATTTLSVIAYDVNNSTVTSQVLEIVVAVPVMVPPPPPPAPVPPIADTFDSFNSLGWQAFGGQVKSFDFDDGTSGECFRNGCIVGMGGNVYDTLVPRIYMQVSPGLDAGAYSIYIKARSGFNNPDPTISICQEGSVGCLDQADSHVEGITIINAIPLDGAWHQYLVAWRQGSAHVERCILQDSMNASNCAWVDTGIELGTKFDGIALWSGSGFRSDVGPPHANLWFDELEPRSVQ